MSWNKHPENFLFQLRKHGISDRIMEENFANELRCSIMYVLNDICYAGEFREDIKVVEAKPLRGGMMLVTFSTGEKRLFDTTLLKGSAFAPLSDERVFVHPVVFHGVITWNNGEIDIAPEAVYQTSYAYEGIAI